MSYILNKKNFLQAFDKSALLTSYCETCGEPDLAIIEFFADREEDNLLDHHEENSQPNYK
tara:strand:+ start:821 stop:1000 length:180 start_codon:yes stop_codon:yes gene_type:complete